MSKIGEYLSLIPKGFPNTLDIINGIINDIELNLGTLDEQSKNEIIKRRIICKTCPFMSLNAMSSLEYKDLTKKNYKTSRKDEHCSFCLCPIKIRTSSLVSNCGAEEWNVSNKEQVELKWISYEKS